MSGIRWSDEMQRELRLLWDTGLTAQEIANSMSTPEHKLTRMSVIGKAQRLGLPQRSSCIRRGTVLKPPPLSAHSALPAPENMVVKAFGAHRLELGQKHRYKPGTLTLEQVQEVNGCRWPEGDRHTGSGVVFCGQIRVGGKSYCKEHYARSVDKGSRVYKAMQAQL